MSEPSRRIHPRASSRRARVIIEDPAEPLATANPMAALDRRRAGDEFVVESLVAEDHVRIVLGPFLDGRSGYVFAVNPTGARYDALIEQIVDDDRREIDSHATKILWIRSGAFEQILHESNYNIYWGQTGVLRSWKVDESVAMEFRKSVQYQGLLDGGVQALREGLQESAGWPGWDDPVRL